MFLCIIAKYVYGVEGWRPVYVLYCQLFDRTLCCSALGKSLPGDRSVLDAYSWERKSVAIGSTSAEDPIACFFATADGRDSKIDFKNKLFFCLFLL